MITAIRRRYPRRWNCSCSERSVKVALAVLVATLTLAGPLTASAATTPVLGEHRAAAVVTPLANRWIVENRNDYYSRATCENSGRWFVANAGALDYYCEKYPGDSKWTLSLLWPNF